MSNISKYKKRLSLVVMFIFVVYSMAYQFAFSISTNKLRLFNENKKTIQNIEMIPNKIKSIKQDIDYFNRLINSGDSVTVNSKDRLIDFTEVNCKKYSLLLIELSEPFSKQYDNYKVFYSQIIIEGDYFQLIRFFYKLEEYSSNLLITSVYFYSDVDRKSKIVKTYCKIVFQTIKEVNNEKII